MRGWRHAAACMLLGILLPSANAADKAISLYFNERPPYIVEADNGNVSGLTATPAANAFRAAGIPFVWVRMPTSRQFLTIQRDLEPACMIGVYKKTEREQYAKFTRPIYTGTQTVALAHRSAGIPDGAKLEDALTGRRLRILVKEMYSYGDQIDELLARFKPEIVRTINENMSMARMLGMRHADLMFTSEEEARAIVERLGEFRDELRIVHFTDALPVQPRHIMCSRQVPDDVVMKLNRAIK